MTILMTLLGVLFAMLTLLFTKLNFKKAAGVFFAFLFVGVFVDMFLATYATLVIGSLTH